MRFQSLLEGPSRLALGAQLEKWVRKGRKRKQESKERHTWNVLCCGDETSELHFVRFAHINQNEVLCLLRKKDSEIAHDLLR